MKTGKILAAVISMGMVLLPAAETAGAVAAILGVDPYGNDVIGGLYDELVGFNEDGKPVIRRNFPAGVDMDHLPDDALVYNEKYIYITDDTEEESDNSDSENESSMTEVTSDESETGDINNDGSVDLTDLTELSLALIGDRTLTDAELTRADIDENGKTDLADLARLKQFLSRVITSLK